MLVDWIVQLHEIDVEGALRLAAVYELEGPDLEGKNKLFRKPWAMTLNMFIGMSFCIPLAYLEERRNRQKPSAGDPSLDASEPLLNGVSKVARPCLSAHLKALNVC